MNLEKTPVEQKQKFNLEIQSRTERLLRTRSILPLCDESPRMLGTVCQFEKARTNPTFTPAQCGSVSLNVREIGHEGDVPVGAETKGFVCFGDSVKKVLNVQCVVRDWSEKFRMWVHPCVMVMRPASHASLMSTSSLSTAARSRRRSSCRALC